MEYNGLLDSLLDCVAQDDKRSYFDFVKVKSNSKMKAENIKKTNALFESNYGQVRSVLDKSGLDKQELRYLRGCVIEGASLTELSGSFDLYNGPFVAFLSSILAFIIFIDAGTTIEWVKAVLAIFALGSAAFSLYRRSQTNAQKIRLCRLKNYLDVYLDNLDSYQLQAKAA